jgi:hypothetical protein
MPCPPHSQGRAENDLYIHFIEDEEDDIIDAFDPRAGDWPQPVKEGLAALAHAYLVKYKQRIGVLDVLRQLREVEATHCQITPGRPARATATQNGGAPHTGRPREAQTGLSDTHLLCMLS